MVNPYPVCFRLFGLLSDAFIISEYESISGSPNYCFPKLIPCSVSVEVEVLIPIRKENVSLTFLGELIKISKFWLARVYQKVNTVIIVANRLQENGKPVPQRKI